MVFECEGCNKEIENHWDDYCPECLEELMKIWEKEKQQLEREYRKNTLP